MSLAAYYETIRWAHVTTVALSGALFLSRGLLVQAGRQAAAMAATPRYASYGIDTVLLTSAILLAVLSRQYPFVQGWLTTKVLLLGAYIVLGSLALKRGRTARSRTLAFLAALLVFGYIVGVALARHPAGWLAP